MERIGGAIVCHRKPDVAMQTLVGMVAKVDKKTISNSWCEIAEKTVKFAGTAKVKPAESGDDDWKEKAHAVYKDWSVQSSDNNSFSATNDRTQAKIEFKKDPEHDQVKAKASVKDFNDSGVASESIALILEVAVRTYHETGNAVIQLNGLEGRPDIAARFIEGAALIGQQNNIEFVVKTSPAVEQEISSNPRCMEELNKYTDSTVVKNSLPNIDWGNDRSNRSAYPTGQW